MAISVKKRPGGQLLTLTDDLRFEFETDQQFEYPYYVRIRVNDPTLVTSNTVITLFNRATQVRDTGVNDGTGFIGNGADAEEVAGNLLSHLQIRDNNNNLFDPELLRQVPGLLNVVEIGWSEDRWTAINAVNFLTNNFTGIPGMVEDFLGAIRRQAFLGFQLEYGFLYPTSPTPISPVVSGDGQDRLLTSTEPFVPAGAYTIELGVLTINVGATTKQHPITISIESSGVQLAQRTLFTPLTAAASEINYSEDTIGNVPLDGNFTFLEEFQLTEGSDELTYSYDVQIVVPDFDNGSWAAEIQFELRIASLVIDSWTTPSYSDGTTVQIGTIERTVTRAFVDGQVLSLYARLSGVIPAGAPGPEIQPPAGSTKRTLNAVQPFLDLLTSTSVNLDFGTLPFQTTGGNLSVRFTNPTPGANLSAVLIWNLPVFVLSSSTVVEEFGVSKEFTFPFASTGVGSTGRCVIDPRKIIQDLMFLNFPALDSSQEDLTSPGGYMRFTYNYTERYVDLDGTLVVTRYATSDGDVDVELPPLAVLRSVVPLDSQVLRSDEIEANRLTICKNTPKWLNIPSFQNTDRIQIRDATQDTLISPQWSNGLVELDDSGTIATATIAYQGSETTLIVDSFTVFRGDENGDRFFRVGISFAGGPVTTLSRIYTIPGGRPSFKVPQLRFDLTGLGSEDTEALLILESIGSDYSVRVDVNQDQALIRQLGFGQVLNQSLLYILPFGLYHFPIHYDYIKDIWGEPVPEFLSFQPFNTDQEHTGEFTVVRYLETCDCSEFTIIWQGLSGGWESMAFERLQADGLEIAGAEIDFYKHESEKWDNFYADTPGTVARIDSARDYFTLRSQRLHPSQRNLIRSLTLSPVHYLHGQSTLEQIYIRPQNVSLYEHGQTLRLFITFYDTDRILTQIS